MTKIAKAHAFLLGVREFRSGVTTHFDDYDLLCTYDRGRELAHKLTRRKYDDTFETEPSGRNGVVHTDEGATYAPWTDGWAVGFHVTAPGRLDRWLLLNPSTSDSLEESNAFVYLEAHAPTTEQPPENPICYISIWDARGAGTQPNDLYDALVELCQQYGMTTEHTYDLLRSAVDSIVVDQD